MNNKPRFVALAAIAAALLSGVPFAAELPKEGTYDVMSCFTRKIFRMRHSETLRAWSYDETATARSKEPGGLFDGDEVRCVGAAASINGKRMGLSFCEGIAPNGDKRLTRFWYDADGKIQREELGGTGRYEGLVTTGSVRQVAPAEEVSPDVQKYCNHLTGTYRMK
jgi:hypothetical protein